MTDAETRAKIQRINDAATIDADRYREDGCADRYEYLSGLAESHELTLEQVLFASDICGGPDEDFDGLITALEDHADTLGEC